MKSAKPRAVESWEAAWVDSGIGMHSRKFNMDRVKKTWRYGQWSWHSVLGRVAAVVGEPAWKASAAVQALESLTLWNDHSVRSGSMNSTMDLHDPTYTSGWQIIGGHSILEGKQMRLYLNFWSKGLPDNSVSLKHLNLTFFFELQVKRFKLIVVFSIIINHHWFIQSLLHLLYLVDCLFSFIPIPYFQSPDFHAWKG